MSRNLKLLATILILCVALGACQRAQSGYSGDTDGPQKAPTYTATMNPN